MNNRKNADVTSEVFVEATLARQTARRVPPLPQGAVVQKSLWF